MPPIGGHLEGVEIGGHRFELDGRLTKASKRVRREGQHERSRRDRDRKPGIQMPVGNSNDQGQRKEKNAESDGADDVTGRQIRAVCGQVEERRHESGEGQRDSRAEARLATHARPDLEGERAERITEDEDDQADDFIPGRDPDGPKHQVGEQQKGKERDRQAREGVPDAPEQQVSQGRSDPGGTV